MSFNTSGLFSGINSNSNTYPSPSSTSGMATEIPKKYIKIDGVMQLNPAYQAYQHSQGKTATTLLNPEKALPVASNMDDFAALNAASVQQNGEKMALAKSTDAMIEMMQDPQVSQRVGLSPDSMVDALGAIFSKYEVPMGLMNKLMALSEYDELEFIIDDSGSMNQNSDTKDVHGRIQTRWAEVHSRLNEMLEVLAHVVTPKMTLRFFNRRDTMTFQRQGETPELFLQRACSQLNQVFGRSPQGGTPAKERLEESFMRGQAKRIARYFFCDGEPQGGERDKESIVRLVKGRNNPEGNPLTFLSCTNEDDQVQWMKELEEAAPYCAEYDDFHDEAREVLQDQGGAFPFTKGFHLVCQLVGAMNPDDLDALDEAVPLTKWTLDNLLGVQTSEQEYNRYFGMFCEAQRRRPIESQADRMKSQQNWAPHYHEFLTRPYAKNVDAVKRFKNMLI